MNDWLLPAFVAAAILSLERMFYALAWHRPATIHWLHRTPMLRQLGAPTEVVRLFFIVFKVLQFGVFAGWWIYFTETSGPRGAVPEFALLLGASLIAFGQMLNVSVFARLGNHGVSMDVAWDTRFRGRTDSPLRGCDIRSMSARSCRSGGCSSYCDTRPRTGGSSRSSKSGCTP